MRLNGFILKYFLFLCEVAFNKLLIDIDNVNK